MRVRRESKTNGRMIDKVGEKGEEGEKQKGEQKNKEVWRMSISFTSAVYLTRTRSCCLSG